MMSTTKQHRRPVVWFAALAAAALMVQCSPSEPAADDSEALRTQLETARSERNSLQETLDAVTRERVDLDGELNRLRQEVEELKGKPEPKSGAPLSPP
jgi:septal ring factor EnvC (AmiA/AmiB activator)